MVFKIPQMRRSARPEEATASTGDGSYYQNYRQFAGEDEEDEDLELNIPTSSPGVTVDTKASPSPPPPSPPSPSPPSPPTAEGANEASISPPNHHPKENLLKLVPWAPLGCLLLGMMLVRTIAALCAHTLSDETAPLFHFIAVGLWADLAILISMLVALAKTTYAIGRLDQVAEDRHTKPAKWVVKVLSWAIGLGLGLGIAALQVQASGWLAVIAVVLVHLGAWAQMQQPGVSMPKRGVLFWLAIAALIAVSGLFAEWAIAQLATV